MIVALMTTLLAAPPDPPIKLWINQDGYFERGDRARVHVRLAEDGYLVVLRADAHGRVRVLFPRDPGDEARVPGGRKLEIRGRGDREAFFVDEPEGTGIVLAARAARALSVADFVRGDHWDYRALAARDTTAPLDAERALLDLVHRMVPDGHFDYDIVRYSTSDVRPYHRRARFRFHVGYGRPFYGYGFRGSCVPWCSAYYDPFFYGFYPRWPYRYSRGVFGTGFSVKQRPARVRVLERRWRR